MNPMAYHHHHDQHIQPWSWDPSNYQHKQRLFEKALTPSDVGKLNRLVIPKQHAEKYFPLDADTADKGLILTFDDDSGKSWRFRYSYWTSSQSYVLTKGWSRFVKDKKVEAGDIVQFDRVRSSVDRLFIGCRRRGSDTSETTQTPHPNSTTTTGGAIASLVYYSGNPMGAVYPNSPSASSVCHGSSVQHDYSFVHTGDLKDEIGESEASVGAQCSNIKRLRLFGVNLECSVEPEPQTLGSVPVYYFGHDSGQFMPMN